VTPELPAKRKGAFDDGTKSYPGGVHQQGSKRKDVEQT